MLEKLLLSILAVSLPMLAMAQEEAKKADVAATEPKIGGEIIFIASFNDDFSGENSQGKVTPLNNVKTEAVDGKFGKAAKFTEATESAIYPLSGNIELKKGKIDVWICPDFTPEDNKYRSIFEIRGVKDKAKKTLNNALGIVKMDYGQLRAFINDNNGSLHRAFLEKLAMKQGEWYHVEMFWDMENPLDNGKYIKLLVNGSQENVQYGLADRKIEFELKDTQFVIGRNFLGSIDAFAIMK